MGVTNYLLTGMILQVVGAHLVGGWGNHRHVMEKKTIDFTWKEGVVRGLYRGCALNYAWETHQFLGVRWSKGREPRSPLRIGLWDPSLLSQWLNGLNFLGLHI